MGMLSVTFIGLVLLAATVAMFSVSLAASAQQPKVREDLSQLGQIFRRLVHQLVSAGVLLGGLAAMVALVGCGLVLLNRTLPHDATPTRPPALAAGVPARIAPVIRRPALNEQPIDEMIARSLTPIVDPEVDTASPERPDETLCRGSR